MLLPIFPFPFILDRTSAARPDRPMIAAMEKSVARGGKLLPKRAARSSISIMGHTPLVTNISACPDQNIFNPTFSSH